MLARAETKKPIPKLEAFLRKSAADPDEPLDPQRRYNPEPGPASRMRH
jgi:hypothetical protein